jgi:hypothetical protein
MPSCIIEDHADNLFSIVETYEELPLDGVPEDVCNPPAENSTRTAPSCVVLWHRWPFHAFKGPSGDMCGLRTDIPRDESSADIAHISRHSRTGHREMLHLDWGWHVLWPLQPAALRIYMA